MYDRYEEGRKTLSELLRFYGDRVEADADYAKSLQKLVTKGHGVSERGCVAAFSHQPAGLSLSCAGCCSFEPAPSTVGDSWSGIKRSHENMSKQFTELSAQVKRYAAHHRSSDPAA